MQPDEHGKWFEDDECRDREGARSDVTVAHISGTVY